MQSISIKPGSDDSCFGDGLLLLADLLLVLIHLLAAGKHSASGCELEFSWGATSCICHRLLLGLCRQCQGVKLAKTWTAS